MNDKRQIEIHAKKPGKGKDLECKFVKTEDGYLAQCPTCPWESKPSAFKGTVKLFYDRHLEYVGVPLL